MKPTYRRWLATLAVAAGVLVATQAFADPPTRVARLNYLKGAVSFRPATLDDWTPAALNYPLTTGDHLWTDASAWAEMHIGSTAIRLAPTTAFAFLNLDDNTTQVRLSEGALDVRVRNLDGEVFEIATPTAAVSLTRPGVYRVDVLPEGGSTRVTVRYGAASVTGDGPEFWVREGETASISGTDEASHEIYRAAPADSWEHWCRARDEREDRVASVRYVSYEMTGYEDLDEYGSWSTIPDYGWAWRPRVSAGWAPYRHGHWRWISPWGWTWVDDAPWGFAPFHYGRWTSLRGSWYWVPGHYRVRPVYAPALVAFIGGDNWGVSFGFGRSHLGWFPLGPGEFWMPHYHASHTYIRNLNVTNVNIRNIDITNYNVSRGTYVNRAVTGAVTAVPRDAFLGGRAVAREAFHVDSRAVLRASVVGSSAPVAPRLESVVGRRAGYAPRPSSSTLGRAVVARTQPPAPPAPFHAQERALQANGGRPLDDTAMARLRTESGARAAAAPVRVAGARGGGWRGGDRGDTGRADAVRGDEPRSEGARGEALRSDRPGSASEAGGYGSGAAIRRGGERTTPSSGQPGGVFSGPGSARPATNDRPSWARPRGGEAQGGSPQPGSARDVEEIRGGARVRPGPTPGTRDNLRGTEAPNDRPGEARTGSIRSRGTDRPAPRGEAGEQARPPRGDQSQPGASGARPRGGEARPAPGGRPSGETARPRSGGRGGEAPSYESSSFASPYTNDRPPAARSRAASEAWSGRETGSSREPGGTVSGGARARWNDRPVPQESVRPSPQYRSMPDSQPAPPQYRAVPQYRAMPESRPVPEYRAMPEYRARPEARPMPQYRAVPESRPEFRPRGDVAPRSYSPAPQNRSYGGAVERGGGGGSAPRVAPAPRPSGGEGGARGGEGGARGGARNRGGRGE